MTVELDLIHTILVSMVVLFAGRALVAHIAVLQRFSIPAPVVGGGDLHPVGRDHEPAGRDGARHGLRHRGARDGSGAGRRTLINTLFIVLACLAGGKLLVRLVEHTGFILPDFVFCLLLGVAIRNLSAFTNLFRMSERTIDCVGDVALSLFLVMALMTMKLLDLAKIQGSLALPLFGFRP